MALIKKFIQKKKAKIRAREEANIRSDFRIVERDGSIYLTHYSVAFMKVPASTKADDVTKMLNEARDTAIEFERL